MSAYIFLLILIAFISVYIGSDKNNTKKRKYSTVVFFSILFLMFSLRDYSVGRDLQGYSDVFDLKGVVSRKKQLIPALMEAAQAGQNDYN